MKTQDIKLYALSTCVYCNKIKKMLDDLAIEFECILADELDDQGRENAIEDLKKINPRCSFPTLVIKNHVITGYKAQEIKEKLGVRTDVDDLHDRLQKINEPKGYYFNTDKEKTFELLQGLLTNKGKYGYAVCPCRLASGDRDKDRDIICPCEYREPDFKKYGSCYCGLYVSQDWNSGKIMKTLVPERRSPDHY